MPEKLKIYQPIKNPVLWDLPRIRADILHAFGKKRVVREEYELSRYYEGIKISPKILYRLQSEDKVFTINKHDSEVSLSITDGKFIATGVDDGRDGKLELLIKSCIENPINLKNPDQKPCFYTHKKFEGKDYFFLSFNHNAIDGYDQEDFILVTFKEGIGLEAKKICRAEYASSRKVDIIDDNGIPTLKIEYGNPDAPGGNYEEGEYKHEITFNLNDEETKTRNGFYRYRTGKTERND